MTTYTLTSITDPSRARRCCFKALGDKLHARRDNKRTTLTLKHTNAQGQDITREISVRVISGKDTNSKLIRNDVIHHSLAIESDLIQGDEGLENRHARVYLSSKSLTTQLKKVGFTAEQIAKVIADISKETFLVYKNEAIMFDDHDVDLTLGSELGSGTYGVVYRARQKEEDVALKFLRTIQEGYAAPILGEEISLGFKGEKVGLSLDSRDSYVGLKAIIVGRKDQRCWIENKFDIFKHEAEWRESGVRIMGTVSAFRGRAIPKGQSQNLEASMSQFLDIARSVKTLHKQRIAHRDIKKDNILVGAGLEGGTKARLIDFGLSCYLEGRSKTTSSAGPGVFRAPEVDAREANGLEVDMWNLGTLLIQMLFPDSHLHYGRILAAIKPEIFIEKIRNRAIQSAISDALVSPQSNYQIKVAISYGDIEEEIIELMLGLLEYHPEDRISEREAIRRAESILAKVKKIKIFS